MNITIRFKDGYDLKLENVEMVRLVGPNSLETKTFGNGPVTHHSVAWFMPTGFNFDTVAAITHAPDCCCDDCEAERAHQALFDRR